MLKTLFRRIKPFHANSKLIRPDESLAGFVWRASGAHQFYAGLIAVCVALFQFIPIDIQRRIVDGAIGSKDVTALFVLGALYLGSILLQSGLKYVLQLYQAWVGESAVKVSRDQLARVASHRPKETAASAGQTVNVVGREIDNVGGFVGTSISEFVINLTLLVAVSAYMIYMQPTIAMVAAIFLVPQIFLALFMQRELNTLVERQVGLVRELGSDIVQDPAQGSRTIGAIFSNRVRFNALKFGLKALLNIANAIGPLMVLLVGGYLVIHGQTTIGTVVAFVSGFDRLSSPLRDLLDFYRQYEQARVQHDMIVRWTEGDPAKSAPRKRRKRLAAS